MQRQEARFRAYKKTVEREAETSHMIEAAEARAIALRDGQLQEISNKALFYPQYGKKDYANQLPL